MTPKEAAALLGRLGGLKRSPAKTAAARANAAKATAARRKKKRSPRK